jgi:DNA-binding PucR family transcriptional regulator
MRSMESSLQAVAQSLEARVDEMVDEMLLRMRSEIADFAALELPELADATRRSAHANVRAGIASLLGGRSTPGLAPAEAEQGARRAARSGAALPELLATYRVGHAVAWDYMLDEIEELELEPPARRELLRIASRHLFAYIDSVLPLVTEAYTQERDALMRSGEHRRLRALRDLLDGARHDADELGYDLHGNHLGAIAWGAHPTDALDLLARALGCRSLVIASDEWFVWGWFALSGPDGDGWSLIESLRYPDETFIAFGTVASGADGFRRTHREAQRACLVARRRRHTVTRFDAVAVEALALRDEPAAREFIVRELGPLAADDARSAVLRDTLRAYFEVSSNASAAAALLGVNDRTVAYRLRGVEDLLGYPVSTRSLELRIALRLQALFGGDEG